MRPVLRLLREKLPAPLARMELAATRTLWQRRALGLLLDSIGSYCLYCESPLTNDAVASRRIEIAEEPFLYRRDANAVVTVRAHRAIRSLGWLNIELMCQACRSASMDRTPTLANGLDYLRTAHLPRFEEIIKPNALEKRLLEDETEDVFIHAILSWIRPDSADDDLATGIIRIPGDFTWDWLAYVREPRTQLELRTAGLLRLEDSEAGADWARIPRNQVWIQPADTCPEAARPRALRTICGLNLNHYNPDAIGDRRVISRTDAWAAADSAVDALEQVVREVAGSGTAGDWVLVDPDVELFAGQIRAAICATGCWTIWAGRLGRKIGSDQGIWPSFSDEARDALLYSLLIQHEFDARHYDASVFGDPELVDKRASSQIDFVFLLPGTDPARLPAALGS